MIQRCLFNKILHFRTVLTPVSDLLAEMLLIQRQAALLVQPVVLVADYLHLALLVFKGHIEQAVVNLVIEIASFFFFFRWTKLIFKAGR